MRMAAGVVGIAIFAGTTYTAFMLIFGVVLQVLQIQTISQFTFMVAVHVGMAVAGAFGRYGWVMFRRDAFMHNIEVVLSSIAAASLLRLNG